MTRFLNCVAIFLAGGVSVFNLHYLIDFPAQYNAEWWKIALAGVIALMSTISIFISTD